MNKTKAYKHLIFILGMFVLLKCLQIIDLSIFQRLYDATSMALFIASYVVGYTTFVLIISIILELSLVAVTKWVLSLCEFLIQEINKSLTKGEEKMILTGKEILKRMKQGQISIDPFDEKQINPNSYNLTLHNELLRYSGTILDMKKPNPTTKIIIPETGLSIRPGEFYLGRTVERTITRGLVPILEGRSSIGRLGMFVHITAGFGDNGFDGMFTLEITTILPLRIYPWTEVCQIYYSEIVGEETFYSTGKYQNNIGIQPSMLYKDFEKK